MLAASCDMLAGTLNYSFGDTHLYENQWEAAKIQSKRKVTHSFPALCIKNKKDNVWDYTFEDFTLSGYEPNPDPLPKVKMVV
jgi:thymidylate synthase